MSSVMEDHPHFRRKLRRWPARSSDDDAELAAAEEAFIG